MSATPDLYMLCAGGHARVLIEVLRRAGRAVAGLTDDDPALHGTVLDGVPVIGPDRLLLGRAPADVLLVNALGNRPRRDDAGLGPRRALFAAFKAKGYRFATVVSPDARVAAAVEMSEGAQVVTGAIVHPGCAVGADAIVNTGAQLDHDCTVGAHSHVAPGAVLCGRVHVGTGCHVGAGAVIVQGIAVGDGAVVAAGAVVTADVAPGACVFGVPAGGRARPAPPSS